MIFPGKPARLKEEMLIGKTLTADDLELLALTRVHPNYRQFESRLNATKWFDYRLEHPVVLTYRFATDYVEAVRVMHAEVKDLEEAERLEVLKGEQDVFRRADLLSFWRARQVADAIGCTYPFLCRFVMKRAAARGWTYYPRPNQITAEDIVLDARDAWRKHIAEHYLSAESLYYSIGSNRKEPNQEAYRTWCIDRVKERAEPGYFLARHFRENNLDEKTTRGRLPDQWINRAIAIVAD